MHTRSVLFAPDSESGCLDHFDRLSPSGTHASASYSQRRNGKVSSMRTYCVPVLPDIYSTPHSSLDLYFWYTSAFGSPLARVQGIGYIQELVARLTSIPIETHNSSTNATLNDNAVTFPLDQSLYVDATHEVVVLNSTFLLFYNVLLPIRSDGVYLSHHGIEPYELRSKWTASV